MAAAAARAVHRHALGSFDFATSGMTSLFSLLKDGVISENKKEEQAHADSPPGPPSDLTLAEVDMGDVRTDIKAAIEAYKNDNSTD
jgi:hypothetical protein